MSVAPAHFPLVGTRASNPLTTTCLPLAIMKPLLLNEILLAASDNLVLRGAHNSQQVTTFRGRNIHLINEALHDRERAVDDATFAAMDI